MRILDYADKSKSKWIEVGYVHFEKPGSDEHVEIIAKFTDKHHARQFAEHQASFIVGPDAIVVR